MNWIKPLSELTLNDIELVGSKAAHLGAMLRAGFNVPRGFVITVDAFTEHFGLVTDPLVKPVTPRLSAELMAAVVSALTEHLGQEAEVAVRSSSTEEDLSFASFAGQHSTYYFVPPTQIDQAIVDCWMSLWSNAALAYRRSGAASVESGLALRMAVIVQQMVPATRAGVVFSKDPASPSTDIVLESCWGLGAALVDGHVNPDLARLSEEGQLLKYRVRDKHAQVYASSRNANGQRLQTLPENLRKSPVLNETEAEHIANLALQLETLFDGPQDVEWAYHDDELFLLQSRPITTRQQPYPYDDKLVIFKPLAENFSEPLTPLSEDLFAHALPKLGVMFGGRLYVDLELAKGLLPFKLSDAQAAQLLLLRPVAGDLHWNLGNTLRSAIRLLGLFLLNGANWIRAGHLQLVDLTRYGDYVARIASNDRLTLKQLMRRLVWARHDFSPAFHQMFAMNISAARYFVFIRLYEQLVIRWAPDYPLVELARTYHGRSDMQSMQMLAQLSDLAHMLHAAPEVLARVRAGDTELPVGHPFTLAFHAFLSRHGHRGPKEIDIAAPRWREQPGMLLKILADTPPHTQDGVHGAFLAERDTLNGHLKPWQRWLTSRLANRISHYIALRENTRHQHVFAFDQMRQRVLDIEQTLLSESVLSTPGDIFYLYADEITQLLNSELNATAAHDLIRARRRERQLLAQQGYAETINVTDAETGTETVGDSGAGHTLLSGLCASPGSVEGTARVIFDPGHAHSLQPGDILVAPYSDPAWTPLFVRAAGAIIANGSFLSHAGTVARELHLPCLVDVADCTQRISDGQRLRLNASAGTVELL